MPPSPLASAPDVLDGPGESLPPFPGFRPEAFAFLRDLRTHNEREWFKPRKETFESELLGPLRCLVAELGRELPRRGLPVVGDPARALFRIYRDTRFSKNKAPYKTHVSAYLSRSGGKDEDGGVYVHAAPDDCGVGGGFWSPDPLLLRRWRARMAEAPDEFLEIAAALDEAGLALRRQDPLARMPRGFESHAASPVADFMKARGLFALHPFPETDLATPDFAEQAVETALALRPLLEWGWGLNDG